MLQGVSIDFQGLLANGAIAGLATPTTPPIDGTAGVDTLNGTPISDLMHGLAGNDLLTDNGGADTLDGGTGTDTMVGGAGNDSYVVDNAKDVINELGGDLDDRVLASIAVDLQLRGLRRHRACDADRRGGAQRHRQRRRQYADRQHRRERAGRRHRQRHADRRRRQ